MLLALRKRVWMWLANRLSRLSSFFDRRARACDKRYFALLKTAAQQDREKQEKLSAQLRQYHGN